MTRLAFCDYHNMIAILEKYEHNVDFHPIVDFVEASYIRYALTINPTVYVSYIRQFWSTARVKTSDGGTKILATIDGKPIIISESSIRRNLKLKDEAGISSLPDAELFENLTLIGVNSPSFSGRTVPLFPTMLVTMGEGSSTPTEPHHTPSPKAPQSQQHDLLSSIHPPVTTVKIPTVIPTKPPPLRPGLSFWRTEIEEVMTHLEKMPQSKGGVYRQGRKQVPTVSIPPAGEIPTVSVSTSSGVVLTASPIFTTATVATPYSRRKGKEKMVESETPKKKKLQEQMDVQMARQLEEEMARDA
nr:hypothetical protein [Tanacetum cinerariifolium]